MSPQHIEVACMVRSCKEEASYWIPFDPSHHLENDTFYLCDEHMETVAGFDEEGNVSQEYFTLNTMTGDIESVEIGVYSCSEECEVCNG